MTESQQLPVYHLFGPNWEAYVHLDEYNSQFDKESQLYEAASQVVEFDKGLCPTLSNKITINIESSQEKMSYSPIILISLEGEENKQEELLTHVVFGNCGLYQEAVKMEQHLNKLLKQIQEEEDKLKGKSKKIKPKDEPPK